MSMVQAWTRTGKGPWSQVDGMNGDPRELGAVIRGLNSAATGGVQFALFTEGHNPNR